MFYSWPVTKQRGGAERRPKKKKRHKVAAKKKGLPQLQVPIKWGSISLFIPITPLSEQVLSRCVKISHLLQISSLLIS